MCADYWTGKSLSGFASLEGLQNWKVRGLRFETDGTVKLAAESMKGLPMRQLTGAEVLAGAVG
jgi:hypothetical protein